MLSRRICVLFLLVGVHISSAIWQVFIGRDQERSRIFRKSQDRPPPQAETVGGRREEGRIDGSDVTFTANTIQRGLSTSSATSTMSRLDWSNQNSNRTKTVRVVTITEDSSRTELEEASKCLCSFLRDT